MADFTASTASDGLPSIFLVARASSTIAQLRFEMASDISGKLQKCSTCHKTVIFNILFRELSQEEFFLKNALIIICYALNGCGVPCGIVFASV